MKEGILISICIPTYNQTGFLKKTLESIAAQTYTNFEVIVSDDSTTHAVKDLVQDYSNVFSILYAHNDKPLGSPANWNNAMSLAKGTLIKFMHHDDWFETTDALEKFVQVFEANPTCDFVFCNSRILNIKENTVSFNKPDNTFIKDLTQDAIVLFNRNLIGAPSATMFRKSALSFDTVIKYVVDVDFYIHYLKQHPNFSYINEALITNTSHHAGQVTAQSMTAEIQVGEHAYLYEKLFGSKIPNFQLSTFFFFLFRQYPIKSLREIEGFKRPLPRPNWYFSLVLRLAKFSLIIKKVQTEK